MVTNLDDGMTSRKFILSVIALLLVSGVTIVANYLPGIVPLYPTFAGVIPVILALYFGGNVSQKYIAMKNGNGTK